MNMDIKSTRGIALYHMLEEELIKLITSNQIKENEKIPTEKELCEMYNVSRTTVRQAISEMERKGYIYKVHGKGTFVAPTLVKQQLLKFYSFTEEMEKLGKVPSSKVVLFEKGLPDEYVAGKLNLLLTEEVLKITRLRLADQKPMMVETTYLPVRRFNELKQEMLEATPMYTVFKDAYEVDITKAVETFRPVIIDEEVSRLLQVDTGMAGMNIDRVTFEGNKIIEYTTSVARGDQFEYSVVLE